MTYPRKSSAPKREPRSPEIIVGYKTNGSENLPPSKAEKVAIGLGVLGICALALLPGVRGEEKVFREAEELPPIECGGKQEHTIKPGENLTEIVNENVEIGSSGVYTQKVVERIKNTNDGIDALLPAGVTITIPEVCTSAG